MSDSLMPFQPAMEEPSNILPSWKKSSSISPTGRVTCCSLPWLSVKRRSTHFTSLSLISFSVFSDIVEHPPGTGMCLATRLRRSGHAKSRYSWEPLPDALRTQRGLKRVAVVSCLDGKGGSLSERQGAADARFRPRPAGLTDWPKLFVALSRQATSLPSKGRLDYGPVCKPEHVRRQAEAPGPPGPACQ